jgi:hypothetical protein
MVPENKQNRRLKQINFIGLQNNPHPLQHTVDNVHEASGNCQQIPLSESIAEPLSRVLGLPPCGPPIKCVISTLRSGVNVTQHRLVVACRRFGTMYRPYIAGWRRYITQIKKLMFS